MSPSSTSGLTALVPRRLRQHVANGQVLTCRGAILFVDIAGFTRLTESARRRHGARGLESLTSEISTLFSEIITKIDIAQGDVLKFGGDALLVAFDQLENAHPPLVRSLWCADQLRCVVKSEGREWLKGLSLHMGSAVGDWQETVVGHPSERLEHFVWGRAITRAMDAAGADQRFVRLSVSRVGDLKDVPIQFERIGPHEYDVTRILRQFPDMLTGQSSEAPAPADVCAFVDPCLRDTLSDPLACLPEHRLVSSLFVFWSSPELRSRANSVSELFREIFRITNESSARCQALWARSDPSGDKQKLLLLFGAPHSRESDTDRALECAQLLRDGFNQFRREHKGFKSGIALATGTVYTGLVGSNSRQEYTAMGVGVNLAARLAAKATNDVVLIDSRTASETTRFRTIAWTTFQLKNVRDPVASYRLIGPMDRIKATQDDKIVEHPEAVRSAVDWWNREAELSLIIHVRAGADARLFLNQFERAIALKQREIRRVVIDASHTSQPLRPTKLLFQELGLHWPDGHDKHDGAAGQLLWQSDDGLAHHLARNTLEQTAELVAQRLESVLAGRPVNNSPRLIIIDHLEHAPALDLMILNCLMNSSRIGARTVALFHGPSPAPANLRTGAGCELGPISSGEFASVLSEILGSRRLSPQLVNFLYAKTQGNARLAKKFVPHLRARSAISCTGGKLGVWTIRNLAAADLPEDMRADYIRSVDRLSLREQTLLRAASVLGDSMELTTLELMCREIMDHSALKAALDGILSSGLVAPQEPSDIQSIAFIDPECRQAIYETMSYALKESWHRRAAALHHVLPNATDAQIGEHLFRGRDRSAQRWLSRCAVKEKRLWLLDLAQRHTRWAILADNGECESERIGLVPKFPLAPSRRTLRLFNSLADILQLQGHHTEVAVIHSALARHAQRNGDTKAECAHLLKVARMAWNAGHYGECGATSRRIGRIARQLGDSGLAAQALYLEGETYRRTGRTKRSQAALTSAARHAMKANQKVLLADVQNALGLLHWNCGRLDDANTAFRMALTAMGRSGGRARRGQTANNLGLLLEEQGLLREARQYYERAFRIFDRLGVRRSRAYSLGNLANLHRHSARYERARAAYEEVELELRAMGEAHAAYYTLGNLGDLARDFGDHTDARNKYNRTLEFALESEDQELIAECCARLAYLSVLDFDRTAAIRLLAKAKAAAKRAGSPEFSLYAQLVGAELALVRRESRAAKQFDLALRHATRSRFVNYQLWALHGLARASADSENRKRAMLDGLRAARSSGYVWWELRFSILAAGEMSRAKFHHKRASYLINQIMAGIGDPRVYRKFQELGLLESIGNVVTTKTV